MGRRQRRRPPLIVGNPTGAATPWGICGSPVCAVSMRSGPARARNELSAGPKSTAFRSGFVLGIAKQKSDTQLKSRSHRVAPMTDTNGNNQVTIKMIADTKARI